MARERELKARLRCRWAGWCLLGCFPFVGLVLFPMEQFAPPWWFQKFLAPILILAMLLCSLGACWLGFLGFSGLIGTVGVRGELALGCLASLIGFILLFIIVFGLVMVL